ncbi:hypothetical protein AK812_SmicGene34945 [Symbiodinium microadriaticum]|uniref:Uncharacterized protein n=1 Tax=Symbiodinium microadriaticum TaxID=2951 RepID=A0A1Q9CMN9_SYMMI|nr:hypothetical protein AK812_SmicGene34945 [Symbiodinium microadriaticum]
MMHPLSGYGLQFFLKAVELGKLQGNYLVEFVQKPARYTGGYLSPYERYKSRHPNELAGTLNDLTYAEGREFAPRVSEIGFRRPAEEIDDPDYVEKLARYTAFLKVEEIPEPTQMDTTHAPMDTSGNIDDDSDAANLPQGEMAGSAKTDATNVTMETALLKEKDSHSKDDVHMGDAEEAKDDETKWPRHWGKQKENVVDPEVFKEAFKAASCAEEKNEKAFDNLEGATEKDDLMLSMCEMDPIYDKRPNRMHGGTSLEAASGRLRLHMQQKRIPPLGCVCVFHLDSKIAATKVGLAHEALGTILVSATGRNQESMDIRGGMYQSTLDCFLEAWTGSPKCFRMCHPRGQHVSANSPCLLKQHENQLGRPYKEGTRPDWNTFPRLDPLVATVLEWGHSTDDDQWAQAPSVQLEYKVSVSEWLLHSTSAAYLLPDRDDDAHTPLLIEVPRTNTLVGGETEGSRICRSYAASTYWNRLSTGRGSFWCDSFWFATSNRTHTTNLLVEKQSGKGGKSSNGKGKGKGKN